MGSSLAIVPLLAGLLVAEWLTTIPEPAIAQASPPVARACIAELAALDRNGDGFVENRDMSEYGPVATNVDMDNDGRLSAEERRIACESGLLKPLKTEGVVG